MALLELENVHTYYGNIHALKGLSITVDQAEIVSVIGGNGAGKSITLKTISGLLHPHPGTIRLAGEDLTKYKAHEIVMKGVVQVPEVRQVFGRLTVTENLEMGAFTQKDKKKISAAMERVFTLFPRLKERRSKLGGTLSGLEPEELMLFFGPDREQRKLISIGQVPRHVSHAVLAAENAHFYEHHGVDPLGILRALYQNLRHGDIRQGGSTITQQLAKNYFLTPERSISRKFKELLMALTMEWIYEKDVILEIYFNEIYLGQNGSVSVNGIGEASLFYFNKQVSELSLSEGATIAGIIRAPGAYSPYVNKERCRSRRDWVLGRMLKQGWISEEQLLMVQAQPVETSGFENYAKRARAFPGVAGLIGREP